MANTWTIQEAQPLSESNTSFPHSSSVVHLGLADSKRDTEANHVEQTLHGDFLPCYGSEGSWYYSMDLPDPGQENGSHGCCQMNNLCAMGPMKLRFHLNSVCRPLHSLALYVLLSLVFYTRGLK